MRRAVARLAAILILAPEAAQAQQRQLPRIEIGPRIQTVNPRHSPRADNRPNATVAAPPRGNPKPAVAPGFSPRDLSLPLYRVPTGQTFTSVQGRNFETTPLVSVREMLQYSPGVSFKQGNTPRDVMISIRGSAARSQLGVQNIVMLEDGFSITQPDGLTRTDQLDPHAYAAIDVYRGPSSALFGNYATNGAINFRTRTGEEINGAEYGLEVGSFGYLNNYVVAGKKADNIDISVFGSDVRSQGWTLHTRNDTQTVNATARWQATPDDRLIFKFIHNQLYTDVSARLSLNQYYLNPYQQGCFAAPQSGSAFALFYNMCGTAAAPVNGLNGPRQANYQSSAWLANINRNDRRDILALRWEHDLDATTKWRTQVIYDGRNNVDPVNVVALLQDQPAVNATSDVTKLGSILGHEARHFAGVYFNRARYTSYLNNVIPVGNGTTGALQAAENSMIQNLGGRGREEIALSSNATLVLGLATEMTKIGALLDQYSYVTGGARAGQIAAWRPAPVNKTYWNAGPEASVAWRVQPDLVTHFRAASGYGTPRPFQLFIGRDGLPGANLDLKTQRNTGLDVGLDWKPDDHFLFSLTGFNEWFQNEQIAYSPGATLYNYTFNAPGTVHRGIEALADWRLLDGLRLMANYTYNNQIFTDFVERLGAGQKFGNFDRAGYRIPGVPAHNANVRLSYDLLLGDLKGVGTYAEYTYQGSYFIDNGNVLTLPSYGLVNANIHFDRAIDLGWLKQFSAYFEVRNIFDRRWIASANNIQNQVGVVNGVVIQAGYGQLSQFGAGSIYAGNSRLFQGGVKLKF